MTVKFKNTLEHFLVHFILSLDMLTLTYLPWVTNETGQLVCTALTVSTAQAYDGLQLATDTDLFLMGEK